MRDGTPFLTQKGDIPSVVWPAVHSHQTATLAAHIHQLEASQWLSADEIAAGQRAQLAVTAGHFAAHLPGFREQLGGVALDHPDLLAHLPILTRRVLQERFSKPPAIPLPDGHGQPDKLITSGSTGEPVTVWKSDLSRLDWLALTMRYYRWGNPDFSGRLAAIRALINRTGEYPDWGAPMAQFGKTGPMLGIDIATDIDVQVAQLQAFHPDTLIVYPSNLAALLAIDLPSLKHIWTLGETLSSALRAEAEERWGVAVYDAYTSEEAGYIALQCPEGGGLYHSMDEMLSVEILDDAGKPCAPGTIGRVVITDLRNHAMPMFRYDIGDHAEAAGPCACGRGLGTMARIMGRTRNMIHYPDGRRHWPLTGNKAYREIAPIRQFQIIQHSLSDMEMRLVANRKLTAAEEATLRDHLQSTWNFPFAVRFTYHQGRLPTGPNGKFEEFLSLIGE